VCLALGGYGSLPLVALFKQTHMPLFASCKTIHAADMMPVDVYSSVTVLNENAEDPTEAESTLQRAGNYTRNPFSVVDYDSDEDEDAVAAMQARAEASRNSRMNQEEDDEVVVIEFQNEYRSQEDGFISGRYPHHQDDASDARAESQPSMLSAKDHRFLFFKGESVLNGDSVCERFHSFRNEASASLRKFNKEASLKCDELVDEAIEKFDGFKKSDENTAKAFRAKHTVSRRDSLNCLVRQASASSGDYPCF
jgi:hypothetical protein